MKYQLPKIEEYTEQRWVRAIETMSVPRYFIADLNKEIAEAFEKRIQSAILERDPYEEDINIYTELYQDIVQEIIPDFLESDDFEVDEVVDTSDETTYEQHKFMVSFLDENDKPISTDNNENN